MAGSMPVPVASSSASSVGRDANYLAPLAVLTTLFFMWGFLTCLNDILSPHLKSVFELNYAEIGLVQTAFFGAYFVMSLPSGFVVKRFGYKNGIIIGLVGAGVGCLLFYPAAGARSYALFLLALFVLASGITLLQVAANPFVAVLGKPDTASSRLTLTQAFNSLGTTLAPLFGSALILATAAKSSDEIKKMTASAAEAYRIAEASAVQTPYLGLAAALVVLALAIAMFKLPKIEDVTPTAIDVGSAARKSAWSYRHLVLGAVGIFVYVGGGGGDRKLPRELLQGADIGGLTEARGAKLVSFYWGGAMVGRFIGTLTLRMYKPTKMLTIHALAACALAIVTMGTSGGLAMWSIIAVGPLQLDHVPDHLHPRHRRPRPPHRARPPASCAWRSWAAPSSRRSSGHGGRSDRHPPLLLHPRALLPLHRLVRRQGGPERDGRSPDGRGRHVKVTWHPSAALPPRPGAHRDPCRNRRFLQRVRGRAGARDHGAEDRLREGGDALPPPAGAARAHAVQTGLRVHGGRRSRGGRLPAFDGAGRRLRLRAQRHRRLLDACSSLGGLRAGLRVTG